MKIDIKENWKDKQLQAIKELSELREDVLRDIVTLLSEPYVRLINKEYIISIQSKIVDIYNDLTDMTIFNERI